MRNWVPLVVVTICLLVSAPVNIAAAPTEAHTYVWYSELVSLDVNAKAATLKARFQEPVARYIGEFKKGDRVLLTWNMIRPFETDVVLHVARYQDAKLWRNDYGYILPAEFVSADAAAKAMTFTVTVPANVLEGLKSIQPGRLGKFSSPLEQRAESAVILRAEATAAPK